MFALPTQNRAPVLRSYRVRPVLAQTSPVLAANTPSSRRRFTPAAVVSVLAHVVAIVVLATITFRSKTARVIQPSFSSAPIAGIIAPANSGGNPEAGGYWEAGNSSSSPLTPSRFMEMGPVIVVEGERGSFFSHHDDFFRQIRADAGGPMAVGGAGRSWGTGGEKGTQGDGGSGAGLAGYLHCPKPDYPRLARQQGWQGTTLLRVEVYADGVPGAVEVAQSSGYEVLDKAALKAVHAWKFQPGRLGDQLVVCWVEVPVRFALR